MSDLSGEYRFRNEGDLLVLQVCEYVQKVSNDFVGLEDSEVWRDAKTEDLLNIRFNQNPIKYPDLSEGPGRHIGPATCGHCHKEN